MLVHPFVLWFTSLAILLHNLHLPINCSVVNNGWLVHKIGYLRMHREMKLVVSLLCYWNPSLRFESCKYVWKWTSTWFKICNEFMHYDSLELISFGNWFNDSQLSRTSSEFRLLCSCFLVYISVLCCCFNDNFCSHLVSMESLSMGIYYIVVVVSSNYIYCCICPWFVCCYLQICM